MDDELGPVLQVLQTMKEHQAEMHGEVEEDCLHKMGPVEGKRLLELETGAE